MMSTLKKRFLMNATLKDYESFAKHVAKNKSIENLELYINPLLWNKASRFLKRRSFETVYLFPVSRCFIGLKCWYPKCMRCRSGFTGDNLLMSVTYNHNHFEDEDGCYKCLTFRNHADTPASLPFLEGSSRLIIKLYGEFDHLERIPRGAYRVDVHGMVLTLEILERLARRVHSGTLDISGCTLSADCMGCTVRTSIIRIIPEQLTYFKGFDVYQTVCIYLTGGPLPVANKIFMDDTVDVVVEGRTTASPEDAIAFAECIFCKHQGVNIEYLNDEEFIDDI